MRFRRVMVHLPSVLAIDTTALESVDAHKVLGVTIQSNLKWDLHISDVVAKASKRLHILRVLKRGGVPPPRLLRFILRSLGLSLNTVVLCGIMPSLSNYQIASSECCVSSFLRCTTKRP